MEKLNEVFIDRGSICTICDIFAMKGITDYRIIKMTGEDGQELKPFESMAGKPLGRLDAIVISPFTESEIQELIEASNTGEDLKTFWRRQTEEGIRHYNTHYCPDDPICPETINYMLPGSVDTSSSFNDNYDDIIQDAILDNIIGIGEWLYGGKEAYLEFRSIHNNYIGSGMIRNGIIIQERKTKDIVVILGRKESERPEAAPDFIIISAFPDITERALTAVPTGRDIRPAIHETDAYKQGSDEERRLLDQKVLNGLSH